MLEANFFLNLWDLDSANLSKLKKRKNYFDILTKKAHIFQKKKNTSKVILFLSRTQYMMKEIFFHTLVCLFLTINIQQEEKKRKKTRMLFYNSAWFVIYSNGGPP